jgi:enoyl-CoA hydratase
MTETSDATGEVVLIQRRGPVLVITLNRPRSRNALTPELMLKLGSAFAELKRDAQLRAAVLTGADGTFCSGMDLKGFGASFKGLRLPREPAAATRAALALARFFTFQQSPKPLIAAVEGAALAGGFELMYQCDLVVAARDARLGLPEVRRGLIALAGVLTTLPHRLPQHLANELALLGEPISAQRAYDIGLVNRVVDPGASLGAALELANAVAANAPLAVAATRRIMRDSRDWSVRSAYARQLPLFAAILASRDAREGARAFAEKREPRWECA